MSTLHNPGTNEISRWNKLRCNRVSVWCSVSFENFL